MLIFLLLCFTKSILTSYSIPQVQSHWPSYGFNGFATHVKDSKSHRHDTKHNRHGRTDDNAHPETIVKQAEFIQWLAVCKRKIIESYLCVYSKFPIKKMFTRQIKRSQNTCAYCKSIHLIKIDPLHEKDELKTDNGLCNY